MRFLFILLFLSLIFCEDVYPYFADPIKQLEFEEKKVFVEEVQEKELILSGGSKFNIAYLWDRDQPFTVSDDIKTDYKYVYTFEITHDNKVLHEIELLRLIGLHGKADELEDSFKLELETYYAKSNQLHTVNKWTPLKGICMALYSIGALFLIEMWADKSDPPEEQIYDYSDAEIGGVAIITAITGYFAIDQNWGIVEKQVKIKNTDPFPIYKQKYVNNQLKSLVESYNRKIFNEIKSQ